MQKTLKKYFPVFLLPTVIAFCIAFIIPFVTGLYLSFCDFTTVSNAKFVGFANFKELIFNDATMRIALKNSLFFTVFSAITQQVLGLLLAVLLTNINKGRNLFKNIYYLPCVLSSAALGLLWAFLFNPRMGINQILAQFGIQN